MKAAQKRTMLQLSNATLHIIKYDKPIVLDRFQLHELVDVGNGKVSGAVAARHLILFVGFYNKTSLALHVQHVWQKRSKAICNATDHSSIISKIEFLIVIEECSEKTLGQCWLSILPLKRVSKSCEAII